MSDKIYLYPLWIRIWHVINALFFIVLIVSGISMQYSNPSYPLMPFDIAVMSHNVAGIGITIAYLFFIVYFVFSPNKKHYSIQFKGLFKDLRKQIQYYTIGVFKGENPPFPTNEDQKFNPLQKVTYVGVIFIVFPILIITGLSLLFPELIVDNVFGVGGTLLTALLHASSGFLVSMFLIIHLYFATMGASFSSNFMSIINGYHKKH